jgi:hypothetical protein
MSWLAPWAFPPNGKTDESFPNPKSESTYKENFKTSCHCLLVLFTSKLNKMTSKIKPKRNKSWQEAINILPANGYRIFCTPSRELAAAGQSDVETRSNCNCLRQMDVSFTLLLLFLLLLLPLLCSRHKCTCFKLTKP